MTDQNIISGKIGIHAEDNDHRFVFLCTCSIGDALFFTVALASTTPIAKSTCKSNSTQRIVATSSFADISEVSTLYIFTFA